MLWVDSRSAMARPTRSSLCCHKETEKSGTDSLLASRYIVLYLPVMLWLTSRIDRPEAAEYRLDD